MPFNSSTGKRVKSTRITSIFTPLITSVIAGSSYLMAIPAACAHDPYDHQHGHSEHDGHSAEHRNAPPPYGNPVPYGYWSGIVTAALTFGGEKLAEVDVETYYDDIEREDIKAGELFMFGGGLLYTQDTLQIQATLNYHVDGVFGDNGDASFSRWPVELLAFWATPQWRIGGGATYHINPELDIDIDYSPNVNIDFKNAAGVVVQAEYRLSEQLSIGLRHTAIEYEPEGTTDVELEGDHTGLVVSLVF